MAETKCLTDDVQGLTAFVDKFDTFLFDCDGVLWSGDHLFEGVPQAVEMLRKRGKRLIFVTNNSTKSRALYKAKFDSMGIPVSVDSIIGSSFASAAYISRILRLPAPRNKVFVLGESGITDELTSLSIPWICGPDPAFRRDFDPATDFAAIASGDALDPDVAVVLSGLDFHVNYLKLSHAFAYLQRGALFLATNPDSTLPNARSLFPGAGSVTAPLVSALGRAPTALGKPAKEMMDAIEGAVGGLDRERTCMVGDRVGTDIRFGVDSGLGGTLGVLTGVSKREEFEGKGTGDSEGVRASAYVGRLGELAKLA